MANLPTRRPSSLNGNMGSFKTNLLNDEISTTSRRNNICQLIFCSSLWRLHYKVVQVAFTNETKLGIVMEILSSASNEKPSYDTPCILLTAVTKTNITEACWEGSCNFLRVSWINLQVTEFVTESPAEKCKET